MGKTNCSVSILQNLHSHGTNKCYLLTDGQSQENQPQKARCALTSLTSHVESPKLYLDTSGEYGAKQWKKLQGSSVLWLCWWFYKPKHDGSTDSHSHPNMHKSTQNCRYVPTVTRPKPVFLVLHWPPLCKMLPSGKSEIDFFSISWKFNVISILTESGLKRSKIKAQQYAAYWKPIQNHGNLRSSLTQPNLWKWREGNTSLSLKNPLDFLILDTMLVK